MKKIIAVLLSIIMVITLSACDDNSLYDEQNAQFEIVEEHRDYKILCHKETGVYYLLYDYHGSYRNGITVMLNADGTPHTG